MAILVFKNDVILNGWEGECGHSEGTHFLLKNILDFYHFSIRQTCEGFQILDFFTFEKRNLNRQGAFSGVLIKDFYSHMTVKPNFVLYRYLQNTPIKQHNRSCLGISFGRGHAPLRFGNFSEFLARQAPGRNHKQHKSQCDGKPWRHINPFYHGRMDFRGIRMFDLCRFLK